MVHDQLRQDSILETDPHPTDNVVIVIQNRSGVIIELALIRGF